MPKVKTVKKPKIVAPKPVKSARTGGKKGGFSPALIPLLVTALTPLVKLVGEKVAQKASKMNRSEPFTGTLDILTGKNKVKAVKSGNGLLRAGATRQTDTIAARQVGGAKKKVLGKKDLHVRAPQ